jgi:signal transduction histidine kinase
LSTLLSRRIARAALPEETRDTFLRQLEGIDAKSNQMVDLIDEFMEAAQRSSGAEPLDLAPVDLVTLVRRTVSCHDATSDRHFMHLEVPDGEMVGYWDAAQLERTVDNLVANAIKYSPQGGDITISLRRKDNHAVLTVQDHGIGIPSHDREHVFDRLYRAQNARSIAGTGMGLATVKQIVDQHQGEISLASSEGQGTTVEIRLPLPAGT